MEEDQEKQPRKQKELQHFALDEADNIIDIKDVETKESGKKSRTSFLLPELSSGNVSEARENTKTPLLPQSTFRLPS